MDISLAFIGHPLTLSSYPYLLPSSQIFTAFQNCNISDLEACSSEELLPILPSLVRVALFPPKATNDIRYKLAQYYNKLIYNHPYATFVTSLYDIDYKAIYEDTRKDISSREKLSRLESKSVSNSFSSTSHQKSLLIGNIKDSLSLDFEKADTDRKVRLLIYEIIRLIYNHDSHQTEKYQISELFCAQSFLPFFSQILCHIVYELPSLFTFTSLSEALTKIDCGPEMLCNLAANNPIEYQNILFTLVDNSEPSNIREDNVILNPIRARAICLLCEMHPTYYSIVRLYCIQAKKYFTVGFILALDETKFHTQADNSASSDHSDLSEIKICDFSQLENQFDDIESNPVLSFLCSLLFSADEETFSCLTTYFKQAMRRSTVSEVFNKIKQYLLEQVRINIPQLKQSSQFRKSSPLIDSRNSESEIMEVETTPLTKSTYYIAVIFLNSEQLSYASLILRVFCVLRLLSTLSMPTDDADTIFSLAIGTAFVPTSHGVEFLKTAIGMLILCPFFYSTTEKEAIMLEWYDRVMQFVNTILEDTFNNTTSSKVLDFGIKELLISIHTQFYLLNYKNVISLLSDLMSIPLKSKNYILSKSKEIFLKVFNDDVCAKMILSLPPTSKLFSHAHQTEIEAVILQSVLEFMKKKSIFQCQSAIANKWLLQQILASSLPINSTILVILQDYLIGLTTQSNNTDSLFPTDEVIAVFDKISLLDDSHLASQLMLLYYLLYLADSLVEEFVSISTKILETVQIKLILDKANLHSSKCQELYPLLIKLVINQYPELWIPQNIIRTKLSEILDSTKFNTTKCKPFHIEKIINQKNPNYHILFIILKQLVSVHIETLRNFLPSLVNLIPLLLNEDIPRQTQNICLLLWKRLESVDPRRLWLSTANALVDKPKMLTNDDLSIDPLILLQSNEKVFRTPPIFSILLHTLTAYLTASRAFLFKIQLQREKEQATDSLAFNELRTSIILTQESAVIQLLIENCIPSEEDIEIKSSFGLHFSNLTEIQCLACCFIHQMIIATPQLVRIIHSQGYPCEMIPILVQGVPSMHICTESLCSLLEESTDFSGIVFVVKLAAAVFTQYPLPETSGVCQKILLFLTNKLAQLKNSSERDALFRPMLGALVELTKTFPSLSEDITLLLLSLMKTEQMRVPQQVENRDADMNTLCSTDKSFVQCILDAFDCLLEEVILKI